MQSAKHVLISILINSSCCAKRRRARSKRPEWFLKKAKKENEEALFNLIRIHFKWIESSEWKRKATGKQANKRCEIWAEAERRSVCILRNDGVSGKCGRKGDRQVPPQNEKKAIRVDWNDDCKSRTRTTDSRTSEQAENGRRRWKGKQDKDKVIGMRFFSSVTIAGWDCTGRKSRLTRLLKG